MTGCESRAGRRPMGGRSRENYEGENMNKDIETPLNNLVDETAKAPHCLHFEALAANSKACYVVFIQ
jgi:hypothetical protein